MARVLLYPTLRRMHEQCAPVSLHFRCFVDDLVFRVHGDTMEEAATEFAQSFGEVIEELKRKALTHSQTKTVVRSNKPKAAQMAVKALAKKGILVTANGRVTDLGPPVGSGRNRIATQADNRIEASTARAKRPKADS